MNTNIFSQIRQENEDFVNSTISVPSGYGFSQYRTLKRLGLYLNSKFEDNSTFLNRNKLFFNITVPPCEVATKMLNVDTKDIRLLPQDPKTQFATYLLEKELKQWLKTSKMANILNEIAEEAPRYGSVVLEKTPDGAKLVDLRRLILDPTVDRIQNSRFVTTVHYMTPSELLATGWKDTDVAVERFGSPQAQEPFEDERGNYGQLVSTPYIKVYKRYGEVPEYFLNGGKGEKMVKAIFIVAGADFQEHNSEGKATSEMGVVLFKSKWAKDWPFKDFHYNKVRGRWLGLGVAEALFDVQERMNEIKNQKRLSMEISTIHLFQTKDKQIVRNILTDLENGDIILSPNGIEPIANEERNLPAFDGEEQSYFTQAQRLSFAYEAVTGESMDASTTATAILNARQQATSTFAFKRENLTNFLRDFFNELVLPQLMKDLTPEHIMRFTGSTQELQKFDEAASELYANDELKKMILDGHTVTLELQDGLRQKAVKHYRSLGDSRYLKIKEAFYDDVSFEFDFNIGNEQISPQTMASNAAGLLQLLANPAALQDPRAKLVFSKYAEALGITPAEFDLADTQGNDFQQKQQALQAQQGPAPKQQVAPRTPQANPTQV